ncbi:MAG: hypothetical protein ACJ8GN_10950 [Longimicrobiaceae bacterium]
MRIYETGFRAEEWDVACTLELRDDGRFEYGEYWTCSLAATGGDVRGSWSREGDAVILRPDWSEGATFLRLRIGEEIRAAEAGDTLDVGDGFRLRLRKEAAAEPAPPPPREPVPMPAAPAAPAAAAVPPSPPEPARSGEAPHRPGPRRPTPELAARVRELIAQLPDGAADSGIVRLCRTNGILPLATTSIYLWGLRPDGVILCVDHESFARRAEVETDPVAAYAAMMQGVRRHPELQPLVPERPPGVVRCGACGGRGYILAPGQRIADGCLRCAGLGWHHSPAAAEAEASSTRPPP